MIDGGEILDRRGRHRQRGDLPEWRMFLNSAERAELERNERRANVANKVLQRLRIETRLLRDRCIQRRRDWAQRELPRVDGGGE